MLDTYLEQKRFFFEKGGTKMQYSSINAIDEKTLSELTAIEQQKLFLQFLHGNTTNDTICMPFILEDGKMIAGKTRHFNLFQKSIDELLKQIHSELDSYISVNPIIPDRTRSADNISAINEIFIDLDVLHKTRNLLKKLDRNNPAQKDAYEIAVAKWNQREIYIQKLKLEIDRLIDNHLLPVPSMVCVTGCGMALHYKYTMPIDKSDKEAIMFHNNAYKKIFTKLESLLADIQAEIELEVDHCVFNHDRICRIMGTLNTKSGIQARITRFDGVTYHPIDLYRDFQIDYSTTVVPEKKQRINKKVVEHPKKEKQTNDIILYTTEDYFFTTLPKAVKNTASFVLQGLEKLQTLMPWVEGSHRNRFMFAYYSAAIICYGSKEAYRLAKECNNQMQEPLSDYEFHSVIKHVDEYNNEEGLFVLVSPQRLVSDTWLDLSEEMIEASGLLRNFVKKKARKKNKQDSIERDKLVAKLYLNGMDSYRQIATTIKETNPTMKCSRNTVKNVIERLGIQDRSISYEEIDFEKNTVYSFYNDINRWKLTSLLTAKVNENAFKENEKDTTDTVSYETTILNSINTYVKTLVEKIMNPIIVEKGARKFHSCKKTVFQKDYLKKTLTIVSPG